MPVTDLIDGICRYADRRGANHLPQPTEVEGLSIVRCRAPTLQEHSSYDPLLCLVLQGAKESALGHERIRFGAGEALIVSLDLPTVSQVVEASPSRPYVALALALDLAMLRGLADEIDAPGESEGASRAIETGVAAERLVAAMGRLFALVEDPVERRVMAPLLKREIHFRLLMAAHGGMLRRLALRDSHESRIHRVLGHIRTDYAAPLRVPDLADMAGMSPSSFHEHFRAITASTPLQYIKDMRLLEARRQIQAGGVAISGVAFAVGYESPAQFSRDYARKFGVAPRDDRAAA
ncbi:AraC family transcriptional regulator [Albibacillus kandeliae]|uniref:AraC family transcriptional regulator n=1 Tax=Albibacillus kandeliae TaxID=2174228 RepID=UPI000D69C1ED|nr:AraC family transcriptional regulator [Albibacillus kandeliae]